MLKHRFATALLALPILFYALIFGGGTIVYLLFLGACLLCSYEFTKIFYPVLLSGLVREKYIKMVSFRFLSLSIIVSACAFVSFNYFSKHLPSFILLFSFAVIALLFFIEKSPRLIVVNALFLSIILIYIVLPWIIIWNLYDFANGPKYILLLLITIMLSDTGAYFAGTYLGKHKLAPSFSPNKTWEGAIGGVLCGVLGTVLVSSYYEIFNQNRYLVFACGVGVSVLGIYGDLFESALKRFSGVKDSGGLLPGHGGLLDRVDAIIFAAPLLYILISSGYH